MKYKGAIQWEQIRRKKFEICMYNISECIFYFINIITNIIFYTYMCIYTYMYIFSLITLYKLHYLSFL